MPSLFYPQAAQLNWIGTRIGSVPFHRVIGAGSFGNPAGHFDDLKPFLKDLVILKGISRPFLGGNGRLGQDGSAWPFCTGRATD